ncbi:hypothetical protein D3C80_1944600 [compost metagenome]
MADGIAIEIRLFLIDCADLTKLDRANAEFFAHLPHQRIFKCFTTLDMATGRVPMIGPRLFPW